MDLKDKRIQSFQARKDKQIAYFNSLNAAISFLNGLSESDKSHLSEKDYQENIMRWRDWFFEQWQNWYLDNIVPSLPESKLDNKFHKDLIEEDEKRELNDEEYQRSNKKDII